MEDYKVFLQPTIIAEFQDPTKLASYKNKVINAWKGYQSGAFLSDQRIRTLFTNYEIKITGDNSIPVFSTTELEDYLRHNDKWFKAIFKDNLIK